MVLISILLNDSVSINTNHQVSKLSYFEKFKSGLNVLRTFDNQLIYTLLISILPYALVVSISVTYPALFKSLSINHEAEFYAALSIPYGAGALFASIINRKSSQNFDKFFTVHSGIFILALIIGALSQNVYVIYGVLFVIAYCHAAIRVQRNTIIMYRVDNHDISKLLSFFEIIFTLLVIILSFILGYLCDHFSAIMSWVFLAVMFSMLLAIFLFNNVRHDVKI